MDLAKLLLNGLATTQKKPSNGGLRVADYPNQYGLRHGENAIPKSTGWLGVQKSTNGDVMTEYSVGDEYGDFPSLVPGLNDLEIASLANENITPDIFNKAQEFANSMRQKGKSPFYDPFIEALSKLPK